MRRLPDSTAHTIAAHHQKPGLLRNIRVPAGAVVAQFPIDDPSPRGKFRPSRRSVRGNSITASAQILTQQKLDRKIRRVPTQSWQSDAWALRRETGELRFIGDRMARAVSQARLFIGKRDSLDEAPNPVDDGPIGDLAKMLFGNDPEVEQALKRYAQHVIFNGESLLLVTEDSGQISWSPQSSTEITGTDSLSFKLFDGSTTTNIDPATQIVVRSWTPDPEYSALPDAPVRAVLPVARELLSLTKYVSAQVDSRLAGAGLLLLPEGIESAMPRTGDEPDDYTFADELTDYMVVPIKDRDSAASVVPFMATVDPQLVDKIKHITFDSPLDPHMHERRQEAIVRIAYGMDSDPAVLTGASGMNHWSGWLVDENEVKLGVAPIVSTICHALTQVVQPLLEQMGVPDAGDHIVWFNTDELALRPDRSKDAVALNDSGVVSDETARRETGFTKDDAPNDTERRHWLLQKLVLAQPNLAEVLLPALGFNDLDWSKMPANTTPAPPPATDPGSAVPDTTEQGPPDTQNDPPAAAEGADL